jgi:hypothetical protein
MQGLVMKNLLVSLVFMLVTVGLSRPAAADSFGWACLTMEECEDAPLSLMIEIDELADFNFTSGTAWPDFLWEISSVSVSSRGDLANVHTETGNPLSGWEGVRSGGYVRDPFIPFQRLAFARDLRVSSVSFQFNNFTIWSDPTFYPFSDAVHDVWSIAYVDDRSRVWTGMFLQCDSAALCLSPAMHVFEPSSLLLLGVGLAGLVADPRRRGERVVSGRSRGRTTRVCRAK